MEKLKPKKEWKIIRMIQMNMLFLVTVMFAVTGICTYLLYTKHAMADIDGTLERSIEDTQSAIALGVNDYLYALAAQVAFLDVGESLPCIQNLDDKKLKDADGDGALTAEDVNAYLERYAQVIDVKEINIIDENGIIQYSNIREYIGFDMASEKTGNEQAYDFYRHIKEDGFYVQKYRPTSYDAGNSLRYAGTSMDEDCYLCKAGGCVQVGYESERIRQEIAFLVPTTAASRRVGKKGTIAIYGAEPVEGRYAAYGVTDFSIYEGIQEEHEEMGLSFDPDSHAPGERFEGPVFGVANFCMYQPIDGYYVVAMIPRSEALSSRNIAVLTMVFLELLVFFAFFILVCRLNRRLVVSNIQKVAQTISLIAGGNLEERVEVYTCREFTSLSEDVNTMVDALKGYIAEAEARFEQELEMARAIQYSALPNVFPPYPSRTEFAIYAEMATAKEVGGDFYDFYLLGEDRLAFLVADVSGQGIPAALFMMRAKTMLKNLAEAELSIEDVFTTANEKLCENNEAGMFVTVWMGILDIRTGKVEYANAGHTHPLVRRRDGKFEYLKVKRGLVLAGMEGVRYRKHEMTLCPGDEIFLYTDGVTEAIDQDHQLYGEERLPALLNGNSVPDGRVLCRMVKEDVDRFAGTVPQFDDITMLHIKYDGQGERT